MTRSNGPNASQRSITAGLNRAAPLIKASAGSGSFVHALWNHLEGQEILLISPSSSTNAAPAWLRKLF